MAARSGQSQGELHYHHWSHDREYDGGYVYVLEAHPLTPVKIGYTTELRARIATLQTGCPYPLRCLHLVPAAQKLESWLHRLLRAERLTGEWFEGEATTAALIDLERMAERMVADDSTDFIAYTEWIPFRVPRTGKEPPTFTGPKSVPLKDDLTVRFVEPTPLTEEEREANVRKHFALPPRPVIKRGGP